ncbi:GGDEF domain-containing protein [Terriglobus saanensis]|uniref:GGDEF domain-containing protein n=1 Tax=Terriglobus saanensis TaxID=870903 RepID=UPI001FE1D6E4|nr:GGDEF domain-containing protein [Terriglobus saanensis]
MFARIVALAVFAFGALFSQAKQAGAETTPISAIVIEGLGKGTASLDGPWQFHPGDDPAWATPAFDSSRWEQLRADRPWGKQGHAHYTGFAWYRCSISLTPAPGIAPQFSLLVPHVKDAYEIYWNGSLIGRNGKLDSHPVWYYSQSAQVFELGDMSRGVLAVRVWKAPLLSDDFGDAGGFESAPLIGSPAAIATARAALDYQWLRSQQFVFGDSLLCALVACLSLLLWLRNPTRWLLFWMTGFAIVSPANLLLLNAHLHWSYVVAMGAAQVLSSIRDVSLWFLLVWLLSLHENSAITRLTRILACICLANGILDGVLIALSWRSQWSGMVQAADAISAFLYTLLEAFPLILAGYALFHRKTLDSTRWLVAITAFLDEMLLVFRNAVKQGRQFTHWPIASSIDSPLFTIGGSAISLRTLVGASLLVAIVYAVYNSVRDDQRRQDKLRQEKVELMRESERIRHYAEHDGLTGLWNHRIIVQRLRQELERSRREKVPLSVILIDVDHFKKVNDTFGHPVGDLVLKELSAIFMSSLRTHDWGGRYGGEEFLLILPGCSIEGALSRAEELRLAVQSARIMDGETMLEVTASFGVASNFTSNHEYEAVIRVVDTALYRAKSSGRNCVVSAEPNMPFC